MWTLVRFLHLSAAAVWIGGQALLLIAAPAIRLRAEAPDTLLGVLGRRFGMISLPALLVLLATGPILASHLQLNHTWQVQMKATLLGVIIILTILHAVLGMRIARGEVGPDSALRRYGHVISLANFLLGLAALLAASSLATSY